MQPTAGPSSSNRPTHPLASRPNSPRDAANTEAFQSVSTGAPSPGYLTPSHGAHIPSRSPSPGPGLTSRRRRKPEGQPTDAQPSDLDDYDPKKRPSGLPFHASPRTISSASSPATTLDRLESFFGISNDPPSERRNVSSRNTPPNHTSDPPGTRLVLQHSVQSTDTLQSLALRYKTDVATLRKVNGLWPNDSVLSRKILWVPLDRCKELGASGNATVGLQGSDGNVIESTPSALGLLSGAGTGANTPSASSNAPLPPHMLHERVISSTSLHDSEASSSRLSSSNHRAPSTSASASVASISRDRSGSAASPVDSTTSPPVVRRLPSEVLGHFPAAKRSETHLLSTKGKSRADQWNEELVDARPKHRLGPGPGMSGYDPGQSGVEDLLQLAREARSRGSTDETEPSRSQPQEVSAGTSTDEITPDESRSEVAVEKADPDSAKSDDWKPNVWHFGEKKQQPPGEGNAVNGNNGLRDTTSTTSPLRPLKLVEQSIEQWQNSSSKPLATPTSSSSYNGWNDVPTLDAYAKGKVVEAYGASKSKVKKKPQRAFFDDLAAGLPANSGQASKWARPIGESLPAQRTAAAPQPKWKNLFSDTLRGRMPLDQALSIGFEEVFRNEWSHLPSEEMEHAARIQQQQRGGRMPAQVHTPTQIQQHPPPGPPRRKSQHEMHVIDVDQRGGGSNHNGDSGRTPTSKWGW